MITVLLSGVVQAGQDEDVRTTIKGAKAWLSKEAFTRSSNFEAARVRMEDVETTDEHGLAELIVMRNKLAHGYLEIHTPKMALQLLSRCAEIIGELFAIGAADCFD